MRRAAGHPHRGTRRWQVGAATLTLVVAGAVCLTVPRQPTDAVPPAAGRVVAAVVAPQRASPPRRGPPSVRGRRTAHPVRLTIPVLGLSTRVGRLGLRPDGTVQVPVDPALAGWFGRGPAPGAVGSAVILGHVDSLAGPAVFYRLSTLTPGELVRVALDDGATASFVVTSVATYAHADFPARQVYGSHGRRELNLVTCGGAYVAGAGGYQANVVVNARWRWTTGRTPGVGAAVSARVSDAHDASAG